MKLVKKSVSVLHHDIPITLIQQEPKSDLLAIFFPGVGYTVQGPLLTFSTDLYVKEGFDVLHVNYNEALNTMEQDDFPKVVCDIVQSVLDEYHYSLIHVVAKSIGTVALASLLERNILPITKAIWFTPLLKNDFVFENMLEKEGKGLVIIGDKDHHFVAERFEQLNGVKHLSTLLVPDSNHSLEIDQDVLRSIDTLKEIFTNVIEFINE